MTIASNNRFPWQIITTLKTQMQQTTQKNTKEERNRKLATFTFYTPKARKITNLFKNTDVKIAFRSTNRIQKITKPRKQDSTQEHNKNGIYKLSCKICNKAYIGQTSRDLTKRHREHIRYIRNNDPQSAYALHILNNRHEYGPLTDTMSLLKPIQKPSLLIPYEQLFIQTFHKSGRLIREQHCYDQNPLYQLAIDQILRNSPRTTRSIPHT